MVRLFALLLAFCGFVFAAVNINTADKKELMKLDGIGAKKADAIIEYRGKHKFDSIEDIKKVDGIGAKLFDKIKADISVSGESTGVATKDKKDSKKEPKESSTKTAKKEAKNTADKDSKKKGDKKDAKK